MSNTNLPLSHLTSENRTMINLVNSETIRLTSLIVNFNQSEQSAKTSDQPSNKSINEDKELYHFYKKEQLIFLVTLLVFIIVGNSLVLLTLACNKRRKPRMNYFIKHLAYSDLLVGLVSVSIDIIWKVTISFNAGNLLCKLVKYSQQLVIYASTYVLVMLSLDRYDAVINPLNFNTRTNRAKHMVFIAWFLSGLLSVPAIFLHQIRIKNSLPQCWIQLSTSEWRLYFTLVSLSLFFVPAIVIFFCYICIIRTIWFPARLQQTSPNNSDRCAKAADKLEAQLTKDQFLSCNEQEQFLNNDQLLKEEKLLNKDQFTNDQAYPNGKETTRDQFATVEQQQQQSNINNIKPEFRDRLSLKLNAITHSSMWPNSSTTTTDILYSSDKYSNNNEKNFSNDTFTNSSPIDKTLTTRSLSNKPLFSKPKSILQKHHSFDQAFDRRTFDRIRMNPKLNSIKEQNRPDLSSNLKIDLLQHQKNSCMRVNSQGIIPKARIKTLQMTCVIITVFICCWSPYIIWDLLQVYGYIPRSAATNAISTFIQSLAPLNSAANPLIFCFFSSKEVFQTIKLIWRRLFLRTADGTKLEHINNRSLTNTTIRKHNNNSSPTTTSVCTKSTTPSRSKSTED